MKYSSQHVDRAVHEAAQVISRDCNGRFFQIGKAQCRRRIMVNHKGGVFGSMAVKPVHKKGSSCHPGSTVCDKQALRNGTKRQGAPCTLGVSFKVYLGGVEEITLTTEATVEDIGDNHTVRAVYSDRVILEGKLHSSLSIGDAKTLVGRTLDLDAAL